MTTAVQSADVGAGDGAFRGRLLAGLATSITQRGYRETTVADIVRNARTSKRTFYDQFASKEECFQELLRANNIDMITTITAAVDPDADWADQIRQAVGAYVDHIESRPEITLAWIRELPAIGASSRPIQRAMMHDLTEMLIALSSSPGFAVAGLAPLSRQLAVFLLGGLRELTALFVEDGHDVRGLVEPAVSASMALLTARPGD